MTSLEDVAKGSVAAQSALEPPDAVSGEDFIRATHADMRNSHTAMAALICQSDWSR